MRGEPPGTLLAKLRTTLTDFTAADICHAITANALDPWHRERAKHELDYILRPDKLDQFIGLHDAGKVGIMDRTNEFGCMVPHREVAPGVWEPIRAAAVPA